MQREKTNRYEDAAVLREALAAIREERLAKPPTNPASKRERIITPVESSEVRDTPNAKAERPRVPSLELQAVKAAPKRRGSMLLTLSAPDEEPPSGRDPVLVGLNPTPPSSTSRPIEASKPATPQPPSGPRAMPKPLEPPPLAIEIDPVLEKRPSRAPTEPPPAEVKSMPPDRHDLRLESEGDMAAALELDIPLPSSSHGSGHPTKPATSPVSSPNAFAPPSAPKIHSPAAAFAPAKVESNPRVDERATRSSNPTTGTGTRAAAAERERVMGSTDRAKLVAAIVVPAIVLASVLHFVTPVLAPVGRALRGETPLAAGLLAVVTLVFAAAIGAKTVADRSRPLIVAAASAVVLGIVMIVVTFSASEAVELGLTPAGAFVVPFLGPVAPFSLAVFFGQRAAASWPNPYEKREAFVNAGIASVLALVGLLLGPFGAVLVR